MTRKLLQLIARIIAIVTITLLPATPVMAAESVNVSITAIPSLTAGIINFTVTYVSDQRIDLSWGFAGDAVNIMIRAKYGSYPDDIPNEDTTPSDGYLVYYGNGVAVSDTSMNFDENAGILYYKAWAQKADGKWYIATSTGWEESRALLLLGFIILALGLTIGAFIFKTGRVILSFAAVGAWALLGVYSYTRSTATWDIYYSLFWLSMGMAIASSLITVVLRDRKEKTETDDFEEENRDLISDIENDERDRANFDRLFKRRRKPKTKMSKFAKTGRE